MHTRKDTVYIHIKDTVYIHIKECTEIWISRENTQRLQSYLGNNYPHNSHENVAEEQLLVCLFLKMFKFWTSQLF